MGKTLRIGTRRSPLALWQAEHIKADDHEGPVYWWGEDRYFDDIGEAIEEALDVEPESLPAHFFACEVVGLQLDATDILEHALENHHEDAYDHLSAGAEKSLRLALDRWVAIWASGVQTWYPDETRYIVVDWEQLVAEETAATATTLEGDRCLT